MLTSVLVGETLNVSRLGHVSHALARYAPLTLYALISIDSVMFVNAVAAEKVLLSIVNPELKLTFSTSTSNT